MIWQYDIDGGNCKRLTRTIMPLRFITRQRNNASADELKYLPALPSEIYTDVLGLFDTVVEQGGFYGSKSANVSTIGGNIKDRTGAVYLAGFLSWNEVLDGEFSLNNPTLDRARNTYNLRVGGSLKLQYRNGHALTAIHELLHFNFHDITLGNAIAALNGDSRRFSIKAGQTMEASRYWNKELEKNCGPTK